MGARAFVGDFGHGKTLGLVRWLEEGREDGCLTATNFGYLNGQHFGNLNHLAGILAVHIEVPYPERSWMRIGIDEVGSLFPNRGASRFPPVLDDLCNRARHFKVEIAYTLPNLSRTDVNLRLATSRVVKCKGWRMKVVSTDLHGTVTQPRRVRFSEYKYEDDKLGDMLDRVSVPWKRLAYLTELYDSYVTSGAEVRALKALAGMDEGSMPDWGVAGAPAAPVVTIDLEEVRGRSAGRHVTRGGR